MMNRSSLWKASVILMFAVMVAMLANSIILIFAGVPENSEPSTYTNISLSLLGMMIAAIIFSGCIYDKWIKGLSQNAFIVLIFIVFVSLYSSLLGNYCNGKPSLLYVNIVSNFIYYAIPVLFSAVLWMYISFQKMNDTVNKLTTIIIIAAVIGISVLIANVFTGFIYSFTPDGWYYTVNAVPAFIAPVFIIIITVYWGLRNLESLIEKFTVLLFAFLSLGIQIIEKTFRGYELIFLCALIIVVIFYTNIYIRRGNILAEKEIEINNQRHAVMVSQIRPHFLYNVLNTITSLDDLPSMRNAIGLFGKYLRGNLDTLSITGPIPFTKELEHVKTYVELEKLRFESKVEVRYQLSELDFEVPPLSVQVLVENAIRYGISRKPEGGIVTIRTNSDKSFYYLFVEDDGIGFDTSKIVTKEDTRSGIENTRNRIRDMMNGTLDVFSEKGTGTRAMIKIPRSNALFLWRR